MELGRLTLDDLAASPHAAQGLLDSLRVADTLPASGGYFWQEDVTTGDMVLLAAEPTS